ncbi:MAG: GDP-mannose 4,6-dehydratase, partial [Omnitrophica bacterium]|nr:GDP-mannose 4,6-dehydratase [Candidatus Omnitrophota bacterium]
NVLGDGEQVRCFTSIFDVGEALAKFSVDKKAENNIFNIGSPEAVSIKELAIKIARIGKEYRILPQDYSLSFKHQPIYADDVKRRIPDMSKMEKAFGWKAKTTLDDALRMYIKHNFKVS